MKKLRLKHEADSHWPEDVTRIVEALASRGYEVSRGDAAEAWSRYSDSVCATWISVSGSADTVFDRVITHLEEAS